MKLSASEVCRSQLYGSIGICDFLRSNPLSFHALHDASFN